MTAAAGSTHLTAALRRDRRRRRQLLGLALLFFAPLGVAFYMYYGHAAWRPMKHVNRGELIDPPRPMPRLALHILPSGETKPDFLERKWTLVYVDGAGCGSVCRARLYDMRQVRTALDRDMDRVQRLFITGGDAALADSLRTIHPDLTVAKLDELAAPWLAKLPGGAGAAGAQRIYVVDPLGNLMMSYGPQAKAKGLLEDMKRLLRLSSIG